VGLGSRTINAECFAQLSPIRLTNLARSGLSPNWLVFDTVFEAMISAHHGKSERMGFEYFYDEAGAGKWLKPGAWGCKAKDRSHQSAEVFALP
jgi:hypothetical protein